MRKHFIFLCDLVWSIENVVDFGMQGAGHEHCHPSCVAWFRSKLEASILVFSTAKGF